MAERRDSFGMKPDVDAVEDIIKTPHHEAHDASGTVNLYQDGTVVLVPTPSPDPKGKNTIPSGYRQLTSFNRSSQLARLAQVHDHPPRRFLLRYLSPGNLRSRLRRPRALRALS